MEDRRILLHYLRDGILRKRILLKATRQILNFAPLASHVWWRIWSFCGLPAFEIGSLLRSNDQIWSVTAASFKNPLESKAYSVGDQYWPYPMELDTAVSLVSRKTPPVFELVLRRLPGQLKKLSKEAMSASVGMGIKAIHYAAVLGSVDCFSVLAEKLGVSVDSRLLHCCDPRFPFGDRAGVLGVLFQRGKLTLAKHTPDLQEFLKAAAFHGAGWVISFVTALKGGRFDLQVPLSFASEYGHPEVCRLLIAAGADVNQQIEEGWTHLMSAAQDNRVDCARVLLEAGADVQARNDEGISALCVAATDGHPEVCRLLIAAGADVNVNCESMGPLLTAAENGRTECCRLLIEAGADVNVPTRMGATPILTAACYGHRDVCRLLIDSGADVDRLDVHGRCALLHAAKNGHAEICRMLLNAGAKVDRSELTELMCAAQLGHAECCRMLIAAGANVNAVYQGETTPLRLASSCECRLVLLEAGATEAPSPTSCANCGKSGCTLKCSRCMAIFYCNRGCQRRHWKMHKRSCNK